MKRAFVFLTIFLFGYLVLTASACSSNSSGASTSIDAALSDAGSVEAAAPLPTVLCEQSASGTFFCNCALDEHDGGPFAAVDAGAVLRYATPDDCEISTLGANTLLCCADDDYPASGSCGCAPSARDVPYHCDSTDAFGCECAYSANPFDAGGSCDLAQYDGGTCCAYRASEFVDSECNCFAASQDVTCNGSSMVVSSCTSAADAGLQVVTGGCAKGTKEVTACGQHALP